MARMQIMSLTEAAAERIRQLGRNEPGGLRVGVTKGGCAGMEYTMEWIGEPSKFDEMVEDKGVKVFVDAKAVLYLLGSVMDYRTDKLSSKFVFENPNQTSACGCGDSIAITPVAPEALAGA